MKSYILWIPLRAGITVELICYRNKGRLHRNLLVDLFPAWKRGSSIWEADNLEDVSFPISKKIRICGDFLPEVDTPERELHAKTAVVNSPWLLLAAVTVETESLSPDQTSTKSFRLGYFLATHISTCSLLSEAVKSATNVRLSKPEISPKVFLKILKVNHKRFRKWGQYHIREAGDENYRHYWPSITSWRLVCLTSHIQVLFIRFKIYLKWD